MGLKYLWIDLETTGLDPSKHQILEFAAIATGPDLIATEVIGGALRFHIGAGDASIDPFVREMHTKNGLWDLCEAAWFNARSMDAALVGFIDSAGLWDGRPILAGSSVHFDRGFLRAHCPETERLLHYRHFDVSTLKMAMRDALGDMASPETSSSTHRARADLEHSLQAARDFRAVIIDGVSE